MTYCSSSFGRKKMSPGLFTLACASFVSLKMKSTFYKSYISLLFAIIVTISLLFVKNDKSFPKEESEPYVVFLQMAFMFFIALMVSLIILCITEKCSNCMCHLETKSFSNIFKKFTARSQYAIILAVTVGVVSGVITLFYLEPSWDIMSSVIGIFLIAYGLLSQEPTTIEISTMWENDNINIGYGLASQFFYGYIKLIMSPDQDWEHRIRRYCAEQGVPIFGKLILLLPKSCNTRNTLTEVDSRIIYAQNLQPRVIHLSGIRREFRHTAWKIDEGTRFVAEYPPPLSTIQDMSSVGTGHHLSSDTKREQLIIFSHHLQDLVRQDPYCSSNCLIIPYDDTSEAMLSEIIDHHITTDELERARAAS